MKTNKINMRNTVKIYFALAGMAFLAACSRERSGTTGWDYNNPRVGGFQKVPYVDQETGPGLILVEGGTFTMGRAEQDVMYDNNNRPRRVTVSSFYMDQTEVTNFDWLEYSYWVNRSYKNYPMVYTNSLPDTLCWRSPLGFYEKFVDYYYRHPAYRDYPVVGVSWMQANDYCKWRTDRVNEYILVREGILKFTPEQADDNTFSTESYLESQFETPDQGKLQDLDPGSPSRVGKKMGKRIVRLEDGILLPRYHLPTEAEWEFASYGLIGNLANPDTEVISERRLYPWDGHWVRQDDQQFQGAIRANFVRGRGDYMGVAGNLNDGGDVTTPVESYWPNDYGLYNMAGNVSEWVLDTYRPMSSEDFEDFRPFRGNVFTTKVLDQNGVTDKKTSAVQYDVHGMRDFTNEFERVRFQRMSAAKHDIAPTGDTVNPFPLGIMNKNISKNPDKNGYEPDAFYIANNKKKDTAELIVLAKINAIIEKAIVLKNKKFDLEASQVIKDELYDDLFANELRQGPDYEYAQEIVTLLRTGFNEFVIETPGKLRYRNVVEEENIGRLNYRKDDYIDYLDGDIESSIFYANDDVKNKINQNTRDSRLIMYQSEHEEFGKDGSSLKPKGPTSWPTTLISDKSKVYKGGSWRDRAYWLGGNTRRYLDQDKSMSTIGFRCAMDRLGSPQGMNYGKKKRKKK
jgi:gliding motility-associated lipoprotein GldJ